MPQYSTGDRVRERVKRFFEALLSYSNGDLEPIDGIQINWQDNKNGPYLAIKTQLRFLEVLIAKDKYPGKLTRDQIRQSLKLLEDFLKIIEDNRPRTKGAQDWQFKIKLWSKDIATNLSLFDQTWESLRKEKTSSKTSVQEAIASSFPIQEEIATTIITPPSIIQTPTEITSIPASTTEENVTVATEFSTAISPEVSSEIIENNVENPETPEITPEVSAEVSTETIENNVETPEVSTEITPEVSTETIENNVENPEVSTEVTPEVSAEVSTETIENNVETSETPEITPEVSSEVTDINHNGKVNAETVTEEETAKVAVLRPSAQLHNYQNIPHSDISTFVGRQRELEVIHQNLQEHGVVAIVAKDGLGGIGKTELAIEYALQHIEEYSDGICWLLAKGVDIGVQILEFVRSKFSHITFPDNQTLMSKVLWCWNNWPIPTGQEGAGQVLVIIDDAINYSQLRAYIPPYNNRFKVLITTKFQQEPSLKQIILGKFVPLEAGDFVTARFGEEQINNGRVAAAIDSAAALQLCEWMSYLPLGLDVMLRYVQQEPEISVEQMLLRLQAQLLQRQVSKGGETNTSVTPQQALETVLDLTWERIDPLAQQLSFILSLFANTPIPWSLVEKVLGEFSPGGEIDKEALIKARSVLLQRHLLQYVGDDSYRPHQAIRQFVQHKLVKIQHSSQLKRLFGQAMVTIAEEIPELLTRQAIADLMSVIPHIAELATSLRDFLQEDDLIWPFTALGRFYSNLAPDVAEFWFEEGLEVIKNRLGKEHPAVATSINNLAEFYRLQGRYNDAESLFKEALELSKQVLGESHPDVASSLNNLAVLYRSQGKYQAAEPLQKQAIDLWKSLLGSEHPLVAYSLNNLASIYYAQARYGEAEPLYKEALTLRKNLFGDDRPEVVTSLNNLAALYYTQGRHQEAEKLYLEALAICDRILVCDSSIALTTRKNLETLRSTLEAK